MSVDDRMKVAKENHVCFSCLKKAGREHRQVNCTRRRQCTKSENGAQCTFTHHPLLHRNNSVNVGVASVTDNQDSLLPVISANIGGQDGRYKRGNVLLDSGAQISLIRRETADSLGLRGKDICVNITKVGPRRRRNWNEDLQRPSYSDRQQDEAFSKSNWYSMHQRRDWKHSDSTNYRNPWSSKRKSISLLGLTMLLCILARQSKWIT